MFEWEVGYLMKALSGTLKALRRFRNNPSE